MFRIDWPGNCHLLLLGISAATATTLVAPRQSHGPETQPLDWLEAKYDLET